MNKDMYFKMMGLKKEAAQPVNQRPVANQGTAAPKVNAPAVNASTGGTPVVPKENVFGLKYNQQPPAVKSGAGTPSSNVRKLLNDLKQKADPVAPVTDTDSYRSFSAGYDYAKSKLPQYDQKGSFWTNLLNKLYQFFGSKKRFGVLKQESLGKSASISSNMPRDKYDRMMSLYSRTRNS